MEVWTGSYHKPSQRHSGWQGGWVPRCKTAQLWWRSRASQHELLEGRKVKKSCPGGGKGGMRCSQARAPSPTCWPLAVPTARTGWA